MWIYFYCLFIDMLFMDRIFKTFIHELLFYKTSFKTFIHETILTSKLPHVAIFHLCFLLQKVFQFICIHQLNDMVSGKIPSVQYYTQSPYRNTIVQTPLQPPRIFDVKGAFAVVQGAI